MVPQYLTRNGFTNVIPKEKFDETKLSDEEQKLLHARKGTLWLSLLDEPGQFELLAEYRVGDSELVPAGRSGSVLANQAGRGISGVRHGYP